MYVYIKSLVTLVPKHLTTLVDTNTPPITISTTNITITTTNFLIATRKDNRSKSHGT